MPTPWSWIHIDGWKPHAVPSWLAGALTSDLQQREESRHPGCEPLEVQSEPITYLTFDMPGMVCMDRPWTTFQIDGLTLDIPCEDVGIFIAELKALKPRFFSHYAPGQKVDTMIDTVATGKPEEGLRYYKLHGFHRCLVLTPDARQELIDVLVAGYNQAEAEATAFYATRKTPAQVLQEANAVANGLEPDAYKDVDFGGKRRPKTTKGEA